MDDMEARNELKKAVTYINTLETRGIHNAELVCMIVDAIQKADHVIGAKEDLKEEESNGDDH